MRSCTRVGILATAVLTVSLATACKKKSSSPGAPDGAHSSIEVTPASGLVANAIDAATVVVTVRDAKGHGLSGVAVRIDVSGTGNDFNGYTLTDSAGRAGGELRSTTAEVKTISAVLDPLGAAVAIEDQPTVEFIAGAAMALSLRVPPTDTAGKVLAPVEVHVVDALGNTADSTATVDLALLPNGNGATLGGTTSRAAVAGVCIFDDLRIESAGIDYQIVATSTGFVDVVSPPFDVVFTPTRLGTVDAGGVATSATHRLFLSIGGTSPAGEAANATYRLRLEPAPTGGGTP